MTSFFNMELPSQAARAKSLPARAGVGLKPAHFHEISETQPAIGFFDHLDALVMLLARYQPQSFSEHLAWSTHGPAFLNDLLPLPYNTATLQRVCDHIDQVQSHLGRRMLLENPATYLEFTASTRDEVSFLTEVLQRTGCGLLLDVNNVHVSSINHGHDAPAAIRALPLAQVGEIHLAGFARAQDGNGDLLLIDSHGAPDAQAVWELYDPFPVVQALAGEEFFRAMAQVFVPANPPRSRLMAFYGHDFADFVSVFPSAASVQVIHSPFAVFSLWAAHQGALCISTVAPKHAQAALVFRNGLDVDTLALLAFVARFSVAAVFWKSGQTKIQGFAVDLVNREFTLGWPRLSDSVVDLFRDEYRLPGVATELLGACFKSHTRQAG